MGFCPMGFTYCVRHAHAHGNSDMLVSHWSIYRHGEDHRLSISSKNCWYLRDFLSTLQDDTPNAPEQMSFDTWCWTLFNPSADALEQHVIALEELCKEDGYMRVERVPLETV